MNEHIDEIFIETEEELLSSGRDPLEDDDEE